MPTTRAACSSRDRTANVFRRNVIAESDVALVLYDSIGGNRVRGQRVRRQPLAAELVGPPHRHAFRRQLLVRRRRARPRRRRRAATGHTGSSNVFDHLRGNLTAADLFAQGFAARGAGAPPSGRFPVLEPIPVVDPRPLAHAAGARRGAGADAAGSVAAAPAAVGVCRGGARAPALARSAVGTVMRAGAPHDRLPRVHETLRRRHVAVDRSTLDIERRARSSRCSGRTARARRRRSRRPRD